MGGTVRGTRPAIDQRHRGTMLNTPGIPSVIRKRAQTPPHLRPDATTTARGPGAQDPEDLKTQQQEQKKKMETIYHAGDILEAAKVLDLNILRDTALLWIAEDFWLSPLPDDWEEAVTVSFFYANTANFPPKKKLDALGCVAKLWPVTHDSRTVKTCVANDRTFDPLLNTKRTRTTRIT